VELDLLVDDIVDKLALDDKLRDEVFEIPDFFRIYNRTGFDVLGDVIVIVLPLAPVPDPVPGERPGIYLEEKGIQLRHMVL